MPLHADELHVDEQLVRRLLERDLHGWAGMSVRRLASSGSSNVLFRLGDELLIRLPRTHGGTESIEKEATWLPAIAPSLPVEVPEVLAVGEPGFGYPERWSVSRWIPGDVPDVPQPAGTPSGQLAPDLAEFVVRLRAAPVPSDALRDPRLRWYRGGPLHAIADDIRGALDECRHLPGLALDVDACGRVWEAALEVPAADTGRQEHWLHGDLLAENLLQRDGRLVAVLDFGGLAAGDPAVDLVVAWEMLDAPAREQFHRLVAVDESEWLRGRAWALAIAAMTFPYYWRSMPQRCASRLVMARAVLADDAATPGPRR